MVDYDKEFDRIIREHQARIREIRRQTLVNYVVIAVTTAVVCLSPIVIALIRSSR